jgi:hypothetical protein
MDCLKSFTIHSSSSLATAPASIWAQNGNNYWVLENNLSSSFVVQGFKNVLIHAIEIVGDVETIPSSANKCLVEDWGTTIQLQGGTIPQISGTITAAPNQWQLDNSSAFARLFTLGKYQNKINFPSPFESVKTINFLILNASGIGAESLVNVSLQWNLQWVFYYTYEGEVL